MYSSLAAAVTLKSIVSFVRARCLSKRKNLKKKWFFGHYVPEIVKMNCRKIVIVLPEHDRKIYNFFTVKWISHGNTIYLFVKFFVKHEYTLCSYEH